MHSLMMALCIRLDLYFCYYSNTIATGCSGRMALIFFLAGMSSSHMRMCNDHQKFYSIGSAIFAWKSYQRKNKQMLIL